MLAVLFFIMTLREINEQRAEAAAELAALYEDLESMRALHEKHANAEAEAKVQVRAGTLELEELVAVQAKRQSVAGIITELEQETADAEAQLSSLEQQADREARLERLDALMAELGSIKREHTKAHADLHEAIKSRLDGIINTELAWSDRHTEMLTALAELGLSDNRAPNATTHAKDAALLAELEGRGVDLSVLEARRPNGLQPWYVRTIKPPEREGLDKELNHAASIAIEAARRERFGVPERTPYEHVTV